MSHSTTPSADRSKWRRQIQEKYQCDLSPELSRWFDEGLWQSDELRSANEFRFPLSPEELVGDAPEAIWPALMPCDFLPLIGNDLGDWLCVRIEENNRASEIVHWFHGGGDWIPWGDSISQAVLFDHLRTKLPGHGRDHAVAAEEATAKLSLDEDVLVQWALTDLGEASDLIRGKGEAVAESLIERNWSTAAVCCQLVIDALANDLIDESFLTASSEDSDHRQRWLFDNRLMPQHLLSQIAQSHELDDRRVLDHQKWDKVERLCQIASKAKPELGWPWEILGYCHERNDDDQTAIGFYLKGIQCSIFSDQTVRLRTHGFNGESQKFSAARLFMLDYHDDRPEVQQYLETLRLPESEQRREHVREFFSAAAKRFETAGQLDQAHESWMRAGWDLGAEPMTAFAELLDHAARAAALAGRRGQAALALTHRQCFRHRYRI